MMLSSIPMEAATLRILGICELGSLEHLEWHKVSTHSSKTFLENKTCISQVRKYKYIIYNLHLCRYKLDAYYLFFPVTFIRTGSRWFKLHKLHYSLHIFWEIDQTTNRLDMLEANSLTVSDNVKIRINVCLRKA